MVSQACHDKMRLIVVLIIALFIFILFYFIYSICDCLGLWLSYRIYVTEVSTRVTTRIIIRLTTRATTIYVEN